AFTPRRTDAPDAAFGGSRAQCECFGAGLPASWPVFFAPAFFGRQQPMPSSSGHVNFVMSAKSPFGHDVGVRPTHLPPAASHVVGFDEPVAMLDRAGVGAEAAPEAEAEGSADAVGVGVELV